MNNYVETAEKYAGIFEGGIINLIDYYNSNCVKFVKPSRRYNMKLGDNWCAMFTSVIASKCGLSPVVFPYEVSVGEQVKLAKAKGQYQQNINLAEVGNLIIYNWNGDAWADHVGIITAVNGKTITAIEGNHNKTVAYRTIDKYNHFIAGIIKF